MKEMKVWPHLTIVAVICAVVAGVGVGLWMKNRQTAEAESVLTAGRIQRVDGDVAVANALAGNGSDSQWYAAEANSPFSVGDRIYTNDNAHTSLAFSGRNFARLYPNTSLDVLALDRSRTQLALRDGSAIFDVGYLDPGQVFEVGTPRGAVNFYEPGLYDVGIGNDGNVLISVLSGLAQVVGLGGTGRISKGELLTLAGQTAAEIVLSRINGNDAGYLIDDYYGYQYPQYYDGRYVDYNSYLNDPYYFDPYRRNVSYQYASSYIPGLNDLDYYGNWQNLSGYGYGWTPRVDNGWSPYQQGYWMNDYPYGPTWVSTEPWGYAPYHYGRWAFVGDRWYWIPDGVNTTPTYSPALVAFVPTTQNEIGWVPLAPGDPYVARYYDEQWNPYYLSNADVTPSRVINLGVPGAIAVAPIDQFVRGYDDGRFKRWDRERFSGSSVVLDPLRLTPLRNAVIHSAWGRGKKELPPGIAKKLDQQVVVSSVPNDSRIRRDFARRFGVRTISEKDKQKQFKDERPNKEMSRFVREGQRVNDNSRADKQLRQELKQANKIERQRGFERSSQPQIRRAEGVRVSNPAVERRINELRNQQQQRRVERSVGRPDKHEDKRRVEFRQQSPAVFQRQAPPQVVQQPVQQQQELRVKPGNGGGGGWKARAEQQPRGGGQPARVEQKQQGGGGAKHGGPPAASSSQGGGKGKGKGKG